MNQILIGLLSFWISNEYTYGAVEDYEFRNMSNPLGLTKEQMIVNYAMQSREAVLADPKFKQVFGQYIPAIGIQEPL